MVSMLTQISSTMLKSLALMNVLILWNQILKNGYYQKRNGELIILMTALAMSQS